MMKHKQALTNLLDFKLVEFDQIDSPISDLEGTTIRQLIMNLETRGRETIFIVIERSCLGDQVSWAKRKCKAEAKVCLSHIEAQLVKLHRESIFTKLDPDAQKTVKTVEQRDRVPLHPEEAEIEDTSKTKIDWLIDIKELENAGVNNKSVTIDDVSIGLLRDYSFFSLTQPQN